MASHRLLTKDVVAREATCSECGPGMRIYPAGRGWTCANRAKAASAVWQAGHPQKMHANREKWRRNTGGAGKHKLTVKDMLGLTGECPIDGEVGLAQVGRGWGCGRGKEFTGCATCPAVAGEINYAGEVTILWPYAGKLLCTSCCEHWAKGLVETGLLEPVISVKADHGTTSLDLLLELASEDEQEYEAA